MMDLKGRYAVITGANQGLGRAIATAFVKAGASVLLTARNTELLDRVVEELKPKAAAGQQVIGMRGDVADEASCAAVMARARESFPELTALVNNAGVYGPMGPIETVDWDVWVQAIRINLLGTVIDVPAGDPVDARARLRQDCESFGRRGHRAAAEHQRVRGLQGRRRAHHRNLRRGAARGPRRRQQHRPRRAQHAAAGPGAGRRAGKGRREVLRALAQAARQRRGSPERGAELAVWLASAESDGITGKLISAVWDPWETLAEHAADLKNSDVYTLRRIVPQDRGLGWGDR